MAHDLEVFRKILAKTPGLLQEDGVHLLHCAAEHDSVDILRFLLDSGVDANAPILARKPLCAAACTGAIAASNLLLQHGADVDGRVTERTANPLHEAICCGQLAMVKWLLQHGADPSIKHSHPPRNALAYAKFWQKDEIASFLAAQGIPDVTEEPEPADVEAQAFFEFIEDVQEWFDTKFQRVYEWVESNGLNSVADRNRVFYLIGYLVNEIWDGGTESVYFNPSGRYVCEMVDALRTIGAGREADLLDAINRSFPNGQPAPADKVRARQMGEFPPSTVRVGQQFEESVAKGDVLEKLHFYWYSVPEKDRG
jgi:hypothetical protein